MEAIGPFQPPRNVSPDGSILLVGRLVQVLYEGQEVLVGLADL